MEISSSRKGISVRQAGIILLALATAVIHLTLAMSSGSDIMTTVMFTLNFLGYVALVAAYFLPLPFLRKYHSLVRIAFIGFTLLTIVLWAIMGMRIPIAYVDKTIEVLLVILLFTDRR